VCQHHHHHHHNQITKLSHSINAIGPARVPTYGMDVPGYGMDELLLRV
jgi:hypothetical protein